MISRNIIGLAQCRSPLLRVFQNNRNFLKQRLLSESKEMYPTVQQLKLDVMERMGVKHGYNPVPPSRSHLSKYIPKAGDLPPRTMQDSFLVGLIPLSSEEALQDKYITFLGHVRVGRLLEDMDIFAVLVAQKHISTPTVPKDVRPPYTLVTAHVDQIDFTDFIPKPKEDIKMSGYVSWVGKSTMEVVVWLEQQQHGTWHKITRALFLIAARDPTCRTAAMVNPLVPATDHEKNMLKGGESRKLNRMKNSNQHVSKVIPTMEEQQMVHDLYMATSENNPNKTTVQSLGTIPMESCTISNVIFSHPEDRNLHNTVFGGFIMRHATELAWILGYKFSKYRPFMKSISDISFHQPIAVNSLIQMKANVVYTHMQYYQIIVFVEIFDPITGKVSKSNTFHFTFQSPEQVQQVFPKSYHEAMMFIDGRRHFDDVMSGLHGEDDKVDNLIQNCMSESIVKNKL